MLAPSFPPFILAYGSTFWLPAVELATGQLRNYRKEDNLTSCLPYSYNPYSRHLNIDTFLTEVIPDEYARLALMAHIGLALCSDTHLHNFYTLIGIPRSGKSTILALANALCGAVDPYSFAGHSIFSRDIEGKRSRFKWSQHPIVCIDELPQEALREEEILKAMTAHSGVEMRGIGKDEHTNNRWKPKLLLATNEQPRYKDTSSAVKERAIFVEITKAKAKEERNARLFVDKLLPEIGAFAASCLELAKQVLDRGYYPLSDKMKKLIDRIANEGNPLKDFVHALCVLESGAMIPTKDLYNEFKTYCEEHGHTSKMASNTMSLHLRTMNIGVESKMTRYQSKHQRILTGIRLRIETDPEPTPKYENDTPIIYLKRIGVNGHVNGLNGTINHIVNSFNEPVEGLEDGVLTVLTVNDGLFMHRKNTNPYNGAKQGISHTRERVGTKKPLIPLTRQVNEPVERIKRVNSLNKTSSTPLTDFEEFDL